MLDQAIAHGGGVVDAAQVRDMLGLADRSRVLELFEKTMRGDAAAVVALLGEMHDAGADPVVILQDLLELTHWVTRLKVTPEAGANVGRQRAHAGPRDGAEALDGRADPRLGAADEGPRGDAARALAGPRRRDGADPAVLRRRPALAFRRAQGLAERRRCACRQRRAGPAPRRWRRRRWRRGRAARHVAAGERDRAAAGPGSSRCPIPGASPRSWRCSRASARRGWSTP